MALFVLSDTHLSLSLNKPMDVFGSRWTNYPEKIEREWRNTVSEEDTVVIPGDISWGMNFEEAREDLRFLNLLPGTKILGRGNHDYWWNTERKMLKFFRDEGFSSLEILHNNAFYIAPFLIFGSRGWFYEEKNAPKGTEYEKIVNREIGRLRLSAEAGRKLLAKEGKTWEEVQPLCFLHFPPSFRGVDCPEILATLEELHISRCYFGHIHGVYDFVSPFEKNGMEMNLISSDYLGFRPLRIESCPKYEETANYSRNVLTFPENQIQYKR